MAGTVMPAHQGGMLLSPASHAVPCPHPWCRGKGWLCSVLVQKCHCVLPPQCRGDLLWPPLCWRWGTHFLRPLTPHPSPRAPQSAQRSPQGDLVPLGTLTWGGWVTSGWSKIRVPALHPKSPQLPPLLAVLTSGGMLLNRDTFPCSAWSPLPWPGRGRRPEATRVALPPGAVAVAVTVTRCPENPLFLPVVRGWSSGSDGKGV